jgi:hypothetical protein
MNGKEHWLEAERILATVLDEDTVVSTYRRELWVMAAVGHALLALAAPPYGLHYSTPAPRATTDPAPLPEAGW